MEREKGWAVWSPDSGILFYTIAFQKETAINRMGMSQAGWKAFVGSGYRTVPVTISYEKPQAGDEEG